MSIYYMYFSELCSCGTTWTVDILPLLSCDGEMFGALEGMWTASLLDRPLVTVFITLRIHTDSRVSLRNLFKGMSEYLG